MRRIYAEGLTKTERHRISDALYRMKREGFIIPTDEHLDIVKNITDASSYQAIRRQVVANPNVEYEALRKDASGRYYRTGGRVSGALAQEYIEESTKWRKERAKIKRKKEYEEDYIPEYRIKGVGPRTEATIGMTRSEISKYTEEAMKEQIRQMRATKPIDYPKKKDQTIRQNLETAVESSILYSPGLKQMLLEGYDKMSRAELTKFTRLNKDLFEAQFHYYSGWLYGGDGTTAPILAILKAQGYDVNAQAPDGEPDETIAEYIGRIMLTTGQL